MSQRALTMATAGLAVALCALVAPISGHVGALMTPIVAAGVLGVVATSVGFSWRGYRHQRLAARLQSWAHPSMLAGIAVQELPETDGAFVAGLRRPQIFCSPDLPASLTPEELRAVLLHERYHQIDRAPAKLVLLETLAPVVSRLPAGRAWLAREVAELEIAADRHAVDHGSSRPALARALLKMWPVQTSAGIGIGFASAADIRLRSLLGEPQPGPARASIGWLAGGPIVIAVGCVLVALAG